VRHVLDYDAMAKVINEKDITISKRQKKLGFAELSPERLENLTLLDQTIPRRRKDSKHSMPSKVCRKPYTDDVYDKQSEKKRLEREEAKWKNASFVKLAITLNEKWKGRMDNNQETLLEEDFVTMAFGEAFVKELKMTGDVRGYVDVPVGDYTPSHLHCHPNLQSFGAPKVHFNQSNGKDLCVSKALASALYTIRFQEEATAIDSFGEEIMKGAVINALEMVKEQARNVLLSWIVIRRLPRKYDWKVSLDP
jgi:hypothetical protein